MLRVSGAGWPVRLAARRRPDPAAAPAGDVRGGRFLPVTSAVYHLVRQPADAVVLLAAAAGAAGIRRPANGGDLESAGRDENAGADLYRNDAGNGLAGRRAVVSSDCSAYW